MTETLLVLSFWGIRSNNTVVCIKEKTLDRRPNTFTRERFDFYDMVRVRDTLRSRTTTTSTTRRGKRALVIRPRYSVCLLEFILAAARKSSGGCARRGGATTLSRKLLRHRETRHSGSVGATRSDRDPLPIRDKFSHFDIPLGAFERVAFVFGWRVLRHGTSAPIYIKRAADASTE